MSNYPPGVTGFEPQIAGPTEYDHTRAVVAPCNDSSPEEEVTGTMVVWDAYTAEFVWDCEHCGDSHSEDFEPEGPEEDY